MPRAAVVEACKLRRAARASHADAAPQTAGEGQQRCPAPTPSFWRAIGLLRLTIPFELLFLSFFCVFPTGDIGGIIPGNEC